MGRDYRLNEQNVMSRLLHILVALLMAGSAGAGSPPPFSVMPPGAVSLPWEVTVLKDRQAATFSIVEDEVEQDGKRVLQGQADAAAAGVVYVYNRPEADAVYASWRWRISNHISGSDMRRREGDDFPARIYLTFDRELRDLPFFTRMKIRLARLLYGREIPTAALCYVWDRELPVGTIMPNAYTDTVMMIVAQSGGSEPSDWQNVARDFRADYRAAFAADAPPLTSVVAGVDTDDTGESTKAWFGDIFIGKVPFVARSPVNTR